MEIVLAVAVSVLVLLISRWVYSWRNPKVKNGGKLPPGSMGLPLLGENLQLVASHGLYELSPFITKRTARYGSLFKTNIIGYPTVVSTDPEFNYYVFQQEGKLFETDYSKNVEEMFGEGSLIHSTGLLHKYLRNSVLNLIGVQKMKEKLLHEVDGVVRKALHQCTHHRSVDFAQVAADTVFNYVATKICSYDESKQKMKLRHNLTYFLEGIISIPLSIPGTTYHACRKGRKIVTKVIMDTYEERRASGVRDHNDFMDALLDEMDKGDTTSYFNKTTVTNFLFLLLAASNTTLPKVIVLVVKLITENPSVLDKLTDEHEGILKGRQTMINGESEITWEEYKSMTFTHMVINETLRIANLAAAVFKRTTQDIEIKGYTIPAGWKVMLSLEAPHLDPCIYEDPLTFNPWRWEGKKKELHAATKNFMPFGSGLRHCAGADFAKVEMAVFIHHLVTKYRWKIIKGGKIIRGPHLGFRFPDGLHLQMWEKMKL